MNDLARDTLRTAWLRGQRQIKGMSEDGRGGLCALGVLQRKWGRWGSTQRFEIDEDRIIACPLCGEQKGEASCIAHLNDFHDCDFAKIAEIMP